MALDKRTEERIEQPVSEQAEQETRLAPGRGGRPACASTPRCAANRKLRTLLERVNADRRLKGWWHVANVNATVRMEINDHSWVHIQIVTNIALKLLRQLTKHHIEPSVVRDFNMTNDDAEVVVVLGALLHDVGMSIHREGHEEFSLFLVEPEIRKLLRRDLRRARADRDHLRGAPGDHLAPLRRRALLARGGRRPGRRRARHGSGTLADPVREGSRLDALPLGRGDRRRDASPTARRSRSRSRS